MADKSLKESAVEDLKERAPSAQQDGAAQHDGAVPRHPGSIKRKGPALARHLLQHLLTRFGSPPLQVVLWNGEEFAAEAPAVARVLIHDHQTFWKLLLDPLFEFGEAYVAGRVKIDGNLPEALTSIFRGWNERAPRSTPRLPFWRRWSSRNTLRRSRENVERHYDLGNDFYKLWLDEELVYTCAYFAKPEFTLEQAQRAKMDHVCRKLRLQPGEEVVEAGCGWGSLARHMARRYGVRVRAFNVSHEQIAYARERAQREGLADRIEYVEDDWRNIDEPCDAFVSVGMLEHVGRENYRQLSDVIHRSLRRHGRGLIHSIGRNRPRPMDSWIQQRIFPGAYPPALSEMMDVFEPHDFSVLDVENLRLHYAQTLRHWLARYEQSVDSVRGMFDESFTRMWRLYLSGSIAAFSSGTLQLFQILFTHWTNNEIPRTRADIYRQPELEPVDAD